MNVAERMCDRIFMIFRGRKVLDGTLDDIQSAYGSDTVRVKIEGAPAVLNSLPGVVAVTDFGQRQEVRLAGDPQVFLSAPGGAGTRPAFRGRPAVAARYLRAHREPAARRARAGGDTCVGC